MNKVVTGQLAKLEAIFLTEVHNSEAIIAFCCLSLAHFKKSKIHPMSSHKSRKRIRAAKKAARPELKGEDGWCEHNYHKWFDTSLSTVKDNVERIDYLTTTCEEFIEK